MPYRIALLPGDGIGPDVIAEARKVVDALGLPIEWTELDWGTDRWHRTGSMMPEDWEQILRAHDAVMLGACGHPSVPDHVSLWTFILPIRQRLDLWANLRPARLLPGVPCPLAGKGPGDIDMLFIRENTEGEYSGVGGRSHRGLPSEVALETSVFTRAGVERVARLGFELARSRKGLLVSCTKSNASPHAYVFWDEVVEEVSAEFPDVQVQRVLVDALAARMIRSPESLDVIIASNLFGDILTDLAAAIQGGMGMAASANVAPGSGVPGMFEPVHGSAPDIVGMGIANPIGAIWSASQMLESIGETEAAGRVMRAIEAVCLVGPRPRDIGGTASTVEVGDAIAAHVAAG